MNPRCVKFKDVYVDPNSQLYKAIKEKDFALAEELYQLAKRKMEKLEGKAHVGPT